MICAGMVGPQTAALAADRGLTLHDYFAREELAVANAVPTALPVGTLFRPPGTHSPAPGHAGAGLNFSRRKAPGHQRSGVDGGEVALDKGAEALAQLRRGRRLL